MHNVSRRKSRLRSACMNGCVCTCRKNVTEPLSLSVAPNLRTTHAHSSHVSRHAHSCVVSQHFVVSGCRVQETCGAQNVSNRMWHCRHAHNLCGTNRAHKPRLSRRRRRLAGLPVQRLHQRRLQKATPPSSPLTACRVTSRRAGQPTRTPAGHPKRTRRSRRPYSSTVRALVIPNS